MRIFLDFHVLEKHKIKVKLEIIFVCFYDTITFRGRRYQMNIKILRIAEVDIVKKRRNQVI